LISRDKIPIMRSFDGTDAEKQRAFDTRDLRHNHMSSIKAPPVHKVTAAQLVIAFCASAAVYLALGWVSAYSLMIGGLISAVPNAYFAHRAFRYRGARAAEKIAREMYIGEAVKLLMMSAGFALSFLFVRPLHGAVMFSGFALVHITGVFMFVRISRPGRNNP
jgi:ATP synthase protein I